MAAYPKKLFKVTVWGRIKCETQIEVEAISADQAAHIVRWQMAKIPGLPSQIVGFDRHMKVSAPRSLNEEEPIDRAIRAFIRRQEGASAEDLLKEFPRLSAWGAVSDNQEAPFSIDRIRQLTHRGCWALRSRRDHPWHEHAQVCGPHGGWKIVARPADD